MSGYPIRRDIVLRGDSASLVHRKDFHRRLELLFNVHVNITTIEKQQPTTAKLYKDRSEGGELVVDSDTSNGWVTVRGKSEEDCLKTQRYVLASSKPECKVLVPCGPQLLKLLFEDSPTLRDAIERDYEALIVAAPSDGGLYIQGSQSSVTMAVSQVHRLADTIPSCPPAGSSMTTCAAPYGDYMFDRRMVTATHLTANQSTAPHLYQPQLTHLDSTDRQNLMIRDLNMTHVTATATPPGKTLPYDTNPSSMGTKYSSQVPLEYSEDSKLRQLVNKYVQLGYPFEQVRLVIESLGPRATENDIMSRLVLVKSAKPTPSNAMTSGNSSAATTTSAGQSKEGLRPIVIDGSNVAMKHGSGKVFSCKGIEIALNYFIARGHSDITIFVPQWRKEPSRPETPIRDQEILFQLENAGYIKFTPSRRFGNRKIVCYDDRFIVQLAYDKGGIIVSDDNFRDLFDENQSWRETIEKRVLQFVFVEDSFMVPQDPLGKHGPHLDAFLRFERGTSPNRGGDSNSDQYPIPKDKTPCPYKEKCTFGPRCRYYHPEREMKQQREKESQQQQQKQQDDTSTSVTRVNQPDTWFSTPKDPVQDELTMRMGNLTVQTSPQKMAYIDPSHPDTRPSGVQNLRHTYPLMGPMVHSSPSESPVPYSHVTPDQQWSGVRREEQKRMTAVTRSGGTDSVAYYPDAAMTMSPSPYSPQSVYQHSGSHSHMQHRTHPMSAPHLPPEYRPSHYSLSHTLHGGNECHGYPTNIPPSSRPHSVNMVNYPAGYSRYKDPRECDQIQSLDGKQKLVYEKVSEMFPQQKDRILALIVQYQITDINTLMKALGK